jgi:Flp pilus assembly pilin Flp
MRGLPQRITVRRMKSESGQTSIEYALVLSLVAIALVGALAGLNGPFGSFVSDLADTIAGLV